jgi:glycosyltransferase involved in cell wall biosynthesis
VNSARHDGAPLVSFGLPVRNGAETITQAIESVQAQTLEDWELVISDNLSSDGTSQICAEFAAKDRRIRHVPTKRDLTIHENFRATYHAARGAFFRWYGDDDWLEAEYAERAVAALAGNPEAVLCTTVQQYYRDGHVIPVTDPIRLGAIDSPDAATRVRTLLHVLEHGGLGIDPVYSLARRDAAGRTGLQNSIRDGDFVYACEMALLGPFVHVPEVLSHRRFVAASHTGSSRNFLQREQAILCVARATKGLPLASRARVNAALVGFAAREHIHGVRRRVRALRNRFLTPHRA